MRAMNIILFGAVLLVAAGCGGPGVELGEVTGTVTDGGQPVPGAQVEFRPEVGRPSTAVTDPEGRYILHYTPEADGALVGTHAVKLTVDPAVAPPAGDSETEQKIAPGGAPREVAWPTPVAVGPEDNVLDFDLSTAG